MHHEEGEYEYQKSLQEVAEYFEGNEICDTNGEIFDKANERLYNDILQQQSESGIKSLYIFLKMEIGCPEEYISNYLTNI